VGDFVFAAVGDVHGHMHTMVNHLQALEAHCGSPLSFVLQVGDFQPVRNEEDLNSMSVPSKYRKMGDFHDFSNGRSSFPWPVWFIGGNHEPYGYLENHPDGAELIKNCHYLGRTGMQELHGLKIAGLTGVSGETDKGGLKSLGHYRDEQINRLLDLGSPDILLLHDWPAGLGCQDQRFSTRGDETLRTVVEILKPQILFCGHQHHNFSTVISHESGEETTVHCLAEVASQAPGIALFRVSGGTISAGRD